MPLLPNRDVSVLERCSPLERCPQGKVQVYVELREILQSFSIMRITILVSIDNTIDLMHNDVTRLDACEECWS